jgi:hypothetical protein
MPEHRELPPEGLPSRSVLKDFWQPDSAESTDHSSIREAAGKDDRNGRIELSNFMEGLLPIQLRRISVYVGGFLGKFAA